MSDQSRVTAVCCILLILLAARFSPAAGPAVPFEVGHITADGSVRTVTLTQTYEDPVVVCTLRMVSNTEPVIVRVANVRSDSFSVWLQIPGEVIERDDDDRGRMRGRGHDDDHDRGRRGHDDDDDHDRGRRGHDDDDDERRGRAGSRVLADQVDYIVMESGSWTINGVRCEAQKYTSTVTDNSRSWKGQQQTYLQSYTRPVVVGQVMSDNDEQWSVFWARGSSATSAPTSSRLYTGKHTGEDRTSREDETIGFIVFESAHADLAGVPFEALVTDDRIQGVGDRPPYAGQFNRSFDAPPQVMIVSSAGMDGSNGGWPVVYGSPASAFDRAYLAVDEDQVGDSERNHTTEQVALLAFRTQSVIFTNVSSSLGFDEQATDHDKWGSGLHWGDLDNDGDPDCIITGRRDARLALNGGDGRPFSVSAIFGGGVVLQGALLDLDHDGDLDYFGVPAWPNEGMLENSGSALFTDAGSRGVSDPNGLDAIAAADVNGDGWCDLVMFAGNGNWILHHDGPFGDAGPTLTPTSDVTYGLNGRGRTGNGLHCSSADVNNDGYLDFFYHDNNGLLFISRGDGTYTESGYGINVETRNNRDFGSAWGDYDNDGDVDLWVSSHDSNQRGYLWRNDVDWETGTGRFTDVTASAGLDNTDGQRGCCWGDYDNDGDLDLYLVTRGRDMPNVLYQNQGDGTFVQISEAAAPGDGLDACFVDYDNDGDLDLSVTQQEAGSSLYENGTDNGNYLKVRVIGAGAGRTNTAGVGVRLELFDSTGTTLIGRRDLGTARGYGGIEPLWAHFGGVEPDQPYLLRAHLAGGYLHETTIVPEEVSTTIGTNDIPQMLTITESEFRSSYRIIRWQEVARVRDEP